MNKNILILIFAILLLFLGAIATYLLFFQQAPPEESARPSDSDTAKSIEEEARSHLENIAGAEASFILKIETPLLASDPEYQRVFQQAQEALTFPVKVPERLLGYALSQVVAWRDQTQGLLAYYEKESGEQFVMQEVTEFFPEAFGGDFQEFALKNGGIARLWTFTLPEGVGKKYVLLFNTSETSEGVPIYYIIDSSSLSPQEMVEVANSAL